MKIKSIIILSSLFSVLSLSSCSQCYECSQQTQIDTNGDGIADTTSTINDKFCSASKQEIANQEANGFTCVLQ